MLLISSPIPFIYVTPAPPEEIHPDPYSPFPPTKSQLEDDGYRANWLSLPPSAASSPWHSLPLRPADRPSHKGLNRDQFNSLLRVSRDQRAKFGSQKAPDIRKELAVKNQSSEQLERRARFLSKVNEASCTTTLSIPGTTLESPTNVVISLPGELCGEQVEHTGLINEQPRPSPKYLLAVPNKSRRIPPSLDEITAHLKQAHVSSKQDYSRSRLPNFLKALSLSSSSVDDESRAYPIRSLALNDSMFVRQTIPARHPDLTPGLRCVDTSYTVNVVAGPMLHTRRVDTARDMIVTLSRRSSPPPGLGSQEYSRNNSVLRRFSAPGQLQHNGQVGLERVTHSAGGF